MPSVNAEVVAVGSELLLGQIVDTNSAVIARHFAAIGLDLFYKATVGDNLPRLSATLRQALGRSTVVVTTGGIGPTADDVTRDAVAEATGRDLVFSEALWAQIQAFFAARGMTASDSNRRQAYLPQGAIPIENPLGTAPAFIVEQGDRTVVALPGVPREMEHLLVSRVIPYLRRRLGLRGEIRLRVLRTVGLGESRLGERLADFMEKGANPTVGTLAHPGQVDVRIAAKGVDVRACEALIAPVEAEIRRRLGEHVFGVDDQTLEGVVADRLRAAAARAAVLEVGTTGLVASRLASAAGEVLASGLLLADLEVASRIGLDVSAQDPESRAGGLAAAVARWADSAVGVAVVVEATGEAGGATVTAGVSLDGEIRARTWRLSGDAPSTRLRAAVLALDHLRRALPGS